MTPVLYEFDKIDFQKRGSYVFQLINSRKLTDICHAHDFFELIWLVRGSAVQRVNGEEKLCEEGNVCLLRPQDSHCFAGQTDELIVVSLSVERREFELFCNMYHARLAEEILKGEQPVCFEFDRSAMIDLPGERNDWVFTEYDCKFLLSCLLKSCIDHTNCLEREHALPDMLSHAADEMKKTENLRKGIPAFTEISHYSQSHLSRLVQKHFGMSLKQYINELRMQRAYDDILLTDRPAQEIAEDLGFASFSHFRRIFKERFSETPASLRKRQGMRTI